MATKAELLKEAEALGIENLSELNKKIKSAKREIRKEQEQDLEYHEIVGNDCDSVRDSLLYVLDESAEIISLLLEDVKVSPKNHFTVSSLVDVMKLMNDSGETLLKLHEKRHKIMSEYDSVVDEDDGTVSGKTSDILKLIKDVGNE